MADAAETDAMRRALEIARRGPTGANPQVGAVILSPDGTVLAEGWHHGAGTPHAEVDAQLQIVVAVCALRSCLRGAHAIAFDADVVVSGERTRQGIVKRDWLLRGSGRCHGEQERGRD